jgi:hypothetical protein
VSKPHTQVKTRQSVILIKILSLPRLATGLLLASSGCLPVTALGEGGDPIPSTPTILARSPFLPPDFIPPGNRKTGKEAQKNVGGYEFRGVYRIGDNYRFLVSEPRSRDGNWVEVGSAQENYEVRAFDATSETLTLFFNNAEHQLKLATLDANTTPLPVSGQIQPSKTSNTPVRRTIRPPARNRTNPTTPQAPTAVPPTPEWLTKLREEAAVQRARALEAGVQGGAPTEPPPAAPAGPPPPFPEELRNIEIPPPPTELPGAPPPELMQQIISGQQPAN